MAPAGLDADRAVPHNRSQNRRSRLSVGVEDIADLLAELKEALG